MVNKLVVGLLLVVVGGTVAGGAYIGLQFAGSTEGPLAESGTAAATATATPTATPTATATASPTPTATATASPTPTATARPSIDASDVEAEVRRRINAERTDRGLGGLDRLDTLREMARFHSDNMAEQGYPSHVAGGFNTAQRYEKFGLADRCKFPDDTDTGIREDEAIEVYGRLSVGEDGRTAAELAATAVGEWFATAETRTILTYENAVHLGVGATVTEDGFVYVTVDLC